jgi:hypothetical protein
MKELIEQLKENNIQLEERILTVNKIIDTISKSKEEIIKEKKEILIEEIKSLFLLYDDSHLLYDSMFTTPSLLTTYNYDNDNKYKNLNFEYIKTLILINSNNSIISNHNNKKLSFKQRILLHYNTITNKLIKEEIICNKENSTFYSNLNYDTEISLLDLFYIKYLLNN